MTVSSASRLDFPYQDTGFRGDFSSIGTDSIASNDAVSVLAEARDAAATLTAAERLELATRGGARALGLSQCGTLVPGHAADLAAFAVRDLARCDAAPERYVIDACSAAPSLLTVVAGAVRARAGRAAIDDALAARMERHRERVRAWAGERRARTSTFAS